MMVDLNYDAVRVAIDVVQVLGLVGVSLYTWFSTRHRATKDAITRVDDQRKADVARVDERLKEHGDRLLTLEQQVNHLPDNNAIGTVHRRIDDVGQGLKGVEGQMMQMNTTLRLIQEHLLGMSS